MFSPFKLISSDQSSLLIGSNTELAERLKIFFQDSKVDYLWNISTGRQRMAPELQHTKMIALRRPVPPASVNLKTTVEWNQVTAIKDDMILNRYPIFQETYQWLKEIMNSLGANEVEFGRVFFSTHLANTLIGEHVDKGAYFSYYDRFHFVIDQVNGENIFHIQNQPQILETGKLYWVNNHVPHWLENRSNTGRINLIFDARLS